MGCGASGAGPSVSEGPGSNPEKLHVSTVDIREVYDIASVRHGTGRTALGSGCYGKVTRGQHLKSQDERAIKHLLKSNTKKTQFVKEIDIASFLDHPNIIKLFEAFEDSRTYYLVMEIADGGELFDAIIREGTFSEVEAASIMAQILSGIGYMHTVGVCHRDCKPENFLLAQAAPVKDCVIKIADFGIAVKCTEGESMTETIGTAFYMSPQVLAGRYTEKTDIWSCGVVLYIVLVGYPPFTGPKRSDISKAITKGEFSLESQGWDTISCEGKALVTDLLTYDELTRPPATKALASKWIVEKAPNAKDTILDSDTLVALKNFSSHNKLKRIASYAIARRLNEDDIKGLRELFKSLDKNDDGIVTYAELQDGISKIAGAELEKSAVDIHALVEQLDLNENTSLDYTEFLAATLDRRVYEEEHVLWSAFSVFDRDGSGFICRKELAQLLKDADVKEVMGSPTIEATMSEADTSSDGMIDFEEFKALMKAPNPA